MPITYVVVVPQVILVPHCLGVDRVDCSRKRCVPESVKK